MAVADQRQLARNFINQLVTYATGTPVSFIFREGTNPYEGKKNVLTERQVKAKRRLMKHVKGK